MSRFCCSALVLGLAALALAACATSPADDTSGFKTTAASGKGAAPSANAEEGEAEEPQGQAGSALGAPPVKGAESCDGLDNNFDGEVDEGCSCKPGAVQACYSGPAATRGVGTCQDGSQTCKGAGEFGAWGPCEGSVGPSTDYKDGKDNDCDGAPDNGYPCAQGQQYSPESCANGNDDDCDGLTDCSDPDCKAAAECQESCNDGKDNDANGLVDCKDPACVGSPYCVEKCGDGKDNDGDGLVDCQDPECSTTVGCSVEVCHDGKDNDDDGAVDCADPDCKGDTQCIEKQQECSAGGTVYVNNLWYCSLGTSAYGVHLWSGVAWGINQGCGGNFGTGGTFTAKCAGTYDVCARVVSKLNQCAVTNQCVKVFVPTDNGTVPLPPFPGFSDKTGACANSLVQAGGHTCIDVSGTTTDNFPVNKSNVTCLADFYFGGSGTGSGSGGGSY